MNTQKITVLIPCYNEEQGITKVLDHIPYQALNRLGFKCEVIVIDNNSSDKTAEVVKSKGAHVIFETAKGKGNAIRKGFDCIDCDTACVVMLDGDNTYDAREMVRLIAPISEDFCDVVVGSRLEGKIAKNALKTQNRLASRIFTFLVRCFYGAHVTDVLSGYYAWRADVIREMRGHLESGGFNIEMEMISKMVKLAYSIYSVPISYNVRVGETKIKPIKDGLQIFATLFRNLFWSPPAAAKLNDDHPKLVQMREERLEKEADIPSPV